MFSLLLAQKQQFQHRCHVPFWPREHEYAEWGSGVNMGSNRRQIDKSGVAMFHELDQSQFIMFLVMGVGTGLHKCGGLTKPS